MPAAGASGARAGRGGGRGAFANQPQPVQVATAAQGDMPIVLNALGTVTPLANVTVRTQLTGTLQTVAFQEGQMVKKGDLLAQVEGRSVALEEFARQMIHAEEMHASEVDKMLRKPGELAAVAPRALD